MTSLAIFNKTPANVRSAALDATIASWPDKAANLFRRRDEWLPRRRRQPGRDDFAKARVGIHASADRRSTNRQLAKCWQGAFNALPGSSNWVAQPEITWPSVSDVASCRCVRPSITTSA